MANLLGTTVDGSLLIGPSSAATAYGGAATDKLYFGSQASDSPSHYHITTNMENYNGNYSKLDIRWYTGQRFYAHTGYGGFRFHEITTNAELFSVGKGDAHVRVDNNLYVGNTIYNNGNAVIHAGNIASQSVSYAVTSGTSSATTQTDFSELSVGGEGVATREYVTSQGYLTSLPSHTHDDRYYTESESDGRFFFAQSSQLANTNLNDLTTRGVYYSADNYGTNTNIPFANYFTMINLTNDAGRQAQLWFGDTPGNAYWRPRQGDSTGWHAWENLITSNNIGSQSVSYATSAGNATTANGANGNFYIDDNYGNSIVGLYASTRYQGVFAMGDSYKLPADGASTGSLYGLAWSHPNAGGVAGNLNTHGLLVMENGTFLAAISGSIRARDDMRAPIFYDSANTSYYLDPNSSTSGYFAGTLRQNDGKYVRDSNYRTISGYSDYYSGGSAGWYRVAEITLTGNCSGAVLFGTLYDHRYDGADAYQISVVARAECDFTSNNESHYINVGCTILGSTNYSNYQSKIRVLLVASSSNSRTYEVQFYETPWNHDTWQLEATSGWAVYSSPQAPRSSTGTARVNYISNQNADYQRANVATYSPIYYDSDATNYYVDPNSNSKLVNLGLGGVTPDARLSVSGDIHMDGYIYQGGTAGVINSWGSRTVVNSGNYVSNARSFRFDNLGYGSTWALDINSSGNVIANVDMRAPIFYDSNDTGYYVDPNSNSYLSTLRVADASGGVSLSVGNGSTHGVYTLDNARKYLVVAADYYPHMAIVASGSNNTNHGAVFSFVGTEGSSARQWNIGIPNQNPFIFSIGYNRSGDNNPHYGIGDGWNSDDNHHARLSIDRDGNTKIRGMLYVNGTSGGISVGNAVIHAGNIGSQSVSYASSAGNADTVDGLHSSAFVRNDVYNSADAGLQVFRNIGTIDGSWPSSDHTFSLENSDAGNIVVNFHRGGYTSHNLWYNGSQFRFDTVVTSTSDFRAPIFYDSADTGYYVDPNSESKLRKLWINNGGAAGVGWSTGLNMGDGSNYWNLIQDAGVARQRNFGTGGYDWWNNSASTQLMLLSNAGNLTVSADVRAPIFYDSNDTNYYGDFAGFSRMSEIGVTNNYVYNYFNLESSRAVEENGHVGIFRSRQSATTNYIPFSFQSQFGNHSWGQVARFHIEGTGGDRPSIQFSSGYNNTRWNVGYCTGADDHFRITQDMGYRPDMSGANDGFGTPRLIMYTNGIVDVPQGYVSNGNPWGTANTAFFPNGITTAGGTNWIYGFTYIGNAPSNGAGHEFTTSGTQYSTGSITTPLFLVNNHSDNTRGYRIHNTSGSSVSAMFTNSSNALVIGAGAFDQVNLNKKVFVNGVALGVNVAPSTTAGRIDASNDIVAYSSSDERLKHNITPIENALDKVKSLTGVEFDWKPEHKHAHGYEGHDTGIIAQQVQDVMPSAVRTNDTGFLAVRYEKLIGLLIEGMKEQQAQIDELKAKLDGLTK